MILDRVLKRTATRWPDSEALVQGDRCLTYREVLDDVYRFAGGLHALGIEKGDAVGIFSENSIEQIVSSLAVQSMGGVAVPINPRLSPGELADIITDANARTLICDGDRADRITDVAIDLPTVEHYIATGKTQEMLSFEEVLADGTPEEPAVDNHPDDTALMMHTSGTTGRPKLVVITHRSQVLNSLSCIAELNFEHDDRALHIAPLCHSAGYLNLFVPCLQLGATHVIEPTFEPERTLDRIQSERITVTIGVPSHFQKLRQSAVDAGTFDTNSLRLVFTSGAQLTRPTVDWVVEQLCSNFRNVYGLTDTTGLITVTGPLPYGDADRYCIGEPFLDAEVRLVEVGDDVSPDQIVEQGERGELITRTEKLLEEYFGRPEKTAQTLRDGWFFTGDVAVQRDGLYYLIDRVDNRIISGGETIYPQELERVLDDHPAIHDCAVVGEPDELLGETVVAYVVTDDELRLDDLDEYWKERKDIADFKRPRELELVDTIPRNQSGKVLRSELTAPDTM